jgi:hypothetical protein
VNRDIGLPLVTLSVPTWEMMRLFMLLVSAPSRLQVATWCDDKQ